MIMHPKLKMFLEEKEKKTARKKKTIVGASPGPVEIGDTLKPEPEPVLAGEEENKSDTTSNSAPEISKETDEAEKILHTVLQVSSGVVNDIQKMYEFLGYIGAKQNAEDKDKFQYINEEMKNFDARIKKIEQLLDGMKAQQATPPVSE